MPDFLQEIRTVSVDQNEKPALIELAAVKAQPKPSRVSPRNAQVTINSPEDVLANLQSQPTEACAQEQLQWLKSHASSSFDIHIPSTQSTSILRAILNDTIPDLWSSSEVTKDLLCDCLSSLPGLRGLLSKISTVETTSKSRPAATSVDTSSEVYVVVLQQVLSQPSLATSVWSQITRAEKESQRRLLWKDFSTILASGKLISTVARYQDETKSGQGSWISSGKEFTPRLANWIFHFGVGLGADDQAAWEAASGLLSKGLGIGYSGVLVESLCRLGLEVKGESLLVVSKLIHGLRLLDQKRMLDSLLPALQYILSSTGRSETATLRMSAFVSNLIGVETPLWTEMVIWLQKPTSTQTISQASRRAIIAVIGARTENLFNVLERNLQIFGESMFIRHAPPLEQEACAEVILLCAAHLSNPEPKRLKAVARSSLHMNGVSSRLNCSSQRARTLGMCVGMAMSRIVEEGSMQMDFDVEDVKSPYAQQLMALVNVQDRVGSMEDLIRLSNSTSTDVPPKKSFRKTEPETKPIVTGNLPSGPRIVEVLSDDENDENDIVPYAKPDSDPEDEDDDPTLINRDKQKPPVYIRDLMSGLRDDEKYERHKLSLEHAAPLIRRKAQFGKEVSDHAIELSTILISLQNPFDVEGFVELRLQALIALLLSDPTELGPWYARQVFEGDYSLSQRGTILSAIGLAARELAGFKDTDALNPPITGNKSFASKRLPEKYHAIYAAESAQPSLPFTPLNAISTSLTDSIIAPLAAEAADTATGPTALKVRTFSSRLTTQPRTKVVPNALASILSDSLFTPLAGHFYTSTRIPSAASVFTTPFFLATYLTTLAVLLHASGPATRALPQLTSDFWALLLAARRVGDVASEPSVQRALLFGFLTILDVNSGDTRRVATELGRELVETQAWAREAYAHMSGGDDEADKLRGLAAGVLVKCGEVMEKWERLLVGDMMDY